MVSNDGKVVLVYNGEIYNYIEIREELKSIGYSFKSTGDTEVLLNAYRAWGEKCLDKFNGMWAFLLYDIQQGKIFGARDRYGVKPLYWYWSRPYVFFGSEIKTILNTGFYQEAVNQKAAARFLVRQQLDIDNETFYAGIEQIPAGSAFELKLDGTLRQWSFSSIQKTRRQSVPSPAEAFYELFKDAVRIRMRSDVPLGVCLSGGLDSTSILCTMADLNELDNGEPGPPLKAFSYMPEEFDESPYIRDTLLQTGAELNRLIVDPVNLVKKLNEVLWYHDEPVHTMAALIQFELMRLIATTGIKVILNGQGADETMGGYPDYFFNYWYSLLRASRIREARSEIGAYCQVHGGDPQKVFGHLLVQFGKALFPGYRTIAQRRRLRREVNDTWFTRDLTLQLDESVMPPDLGLDTALRLSVERQELPLYLRIEDRNSMAHSVEARLPFMDYRLLSLLFSLPPEWKMRGPWGKYILREAMAKRIPDSIKNRTDKMGFALPWRKWIATVLRDPIQDVLRSRQARERGIYNLGVIQKDLDLHRDGQTDVTWKIFCVFQYELWSRMDRPTHRLASPLPSK